MSLLSKLDTLQLSKESMSTSLKGGPNPDPGIQSIIISVFYRSGSETVFTIFHHVNNIDGRTSFNV